VFTSWEISPVSTGMSYALTFRLTSENRSLTSYKMASLGTVQRIEFEDILKQYKRRSEIYSENVTSIVA
jgi:predicted component of viral defense system (DUF524 family)